MSIDTKLNTRTGAGEKDWPRGKQLNPVKVYSEEPQVKEGTQRDLW